MTVGSKDSNTLFIFFVRQVRSTVLSHILASAGASPQKCLISHVWLERESSPAGLIYALEKTTVSLYLSQPTLK